MEIVNSGINFYGNEYFKYSFENRGSLTLSVVSDGETYNICLIYNRKLLPASEHNLFNEDYFDGATQKDLDVIIQTLESEIKIGGVL